MAPPIEDLAVAWASLTRDGESGDGWRSIAISHEGATLVHAGRRFPDGAESILARFSTQTISPQTKWPEGSGFTVAPIALKDGFVWVALTRREAASLELFSAMASDVASELSRCPSDSDSKALAVLLGRVHAWQEFMRRGGHPLEPEAEIGLYGEISTLLMLFDEGVSRFAACEGWKGPIRGLRDFELGSGSLEVKSSISTTGFRARVSTLSQLDDTHRQPLFLIALRLQLSEKGRTLAETVRLAREAVGSDAETRRTLEDRLIASGYRDTHADQYIRKFVMAEVRALKVGSGFPRLIPSSVPYGILGASYEIDIDRVAVESVELSAALRDMGAV
jgi:hypothetical protein